MCARRPQGNLSLQSGARRKRLGHSRQRRGRTRNLGWSWTTKRPRAAVLQRCSTPLPTQKQHGQLSSQGGGLGCCTIGKRHGVHGAAEEQAGRSHRTEVPPSCCLRSLSCRTVCTEEGTSGSHVLACAATLNAQCVLLLKARKQTTSFGSLATAEFYGVYTAAIIQIMFCSLCMKSVFGNRKHRTTEDRIAIIFAPFALSGRGEGHLVQVTFWRDLRTSLKLEVAFLRPCCSEFTTAVLKTSSQCVV